METFEKLYELSKTNSHVYFYFISQGNRTSKLNHFKDQEGGIVIRLSHYLIGGQLYRNGNAVYPKQKDETFDHWYDYLSTAYFRSAMEKTA